MGPTARLIEAKNLDEATRQTIVSEIEAAFAAEAAAGPIRLPATIFLVCAPPPGLKVPGSAEQHAVKRGRLTLLLNLPSCLGTRQHVNQVVRTRPLSSSGTP